MIGGVEWSNNSEMRRGQSLKTAQSVLSTHVERQDYGSALRDDESPRVKGWEQLNSDEVQRELTRKCQRQKRVQMSIFKSPSVQSRRSRTKKEKKKKKRDRHLPNSGLACLPSSVIRCRSLIGHFGTSTVPSQLI